MLIASTKKVIADDDDFVDDIYIPKEKSKVDSEKP